jgi:hypothetical protein
MISLVEIFAKHGTLTHAKLTQKDLQKNLNGVERNKNIQRGRQDTVTKYPSSRSRTGLKRHYRKLNSIKMRKS